MDRINIDSLSFLHKEKQGKVRTGTKALSMTAKKFPSTSTGNMTGGKLHHAKHIMFTEKNGHLSLSGLKG